MRFELDPRTARPSCLVHTLRISMTVVVVALVFLLLLPSAPLLAQISVLEPLLLEGDSEVPGVGTVSGFGSFAINDGGNWMAEVDTDDPDPNTNTVLLIDGALAIREGDVMTPGPSGATLGSFDSVTLNNAGHGGFNFFLDGVADDSGVYAFLDPSMGFGSGTVLVQQEGEDSPDFPPPTPVLGFFDVKINDADQLLVTTSIDAAAIPSGVDRALFVLTPDPSGGILTSELIAAEGDVLPGQSTGLSDFGTGFTETAINDLGHVLFAVDIPGGLDAIYFYDGALAEVAQEGDPSPLAGRNWQTLTSTALALNDAEDVVFRGQLDGDGASNEVLVRNNQKLVQEGDVLAAIAPFAITDLAGPVWLTEAGEVLWFGQWSDPDASRDTGLFLDDELLIQEGVTATGDAQTVTGLWAQDNGFALSDNGRFALVRATTVLDGLYRIELGVFGDGFESGDTTAWSSTVGGP